MSYLLGFRTSATNIYACTLYSRTKQICIDFSHNFAKYRKFMILTFLFCSVLCQRTHQETERSSNMEIQQHWVVGNNFCHKSTKILRKSAKVKLKNGGEDDLAGKGANMKMFQDGQEMVFLPVDIPWRRQAVCYTGRSTLF